MSLKKPIVFSIIAHIAVVGSLWLLPRNSSLTESLQDLSMEIFENIKDQSSVNQKSRFQKKSSQEPIVTSKIEKAATVSNKAAQNIDALTSSTSEDTAANFGAEVSDGAQVTSKAKLIQDYKVPYPSEAKAHEIEGPVVMDLVIDKTGKVVEAKLVRGPGYGLNEAALQASAQFLFKPAMIDSQPVAVRIRYTYRFVLDTR